MTTNFPNSEPAPEPEYQSEYQPDVQYPYANSPAAPYGEPAAQPDAYAPYGGQPGQPGQPAGQPGYPGAYAGPYPGGYPGYGDFYAPPPAPPRRRRHWRLGVGIAALTAAALVGGIAIGDAVSGNSTTVAGSGSQADGSGGSGGQVIPDDPSGGGLFPNGGSGGSGSGSGGSGGGGTSTSVTLANTKQKVGVVTIVSTLRYQNSQSAGTGMILSSDGEVLTNNHVVNGATSIVVTVASTGKSYRADVVGTAPTEDVAVLQLRNASGLKTANLASSTGSVKVGNKVIGVGNAGGTGTLRASSGSVVALDQTITASDDGSGTNAEKLDGLIEVNAPIISGDSGGPLYDSSGKVIGMDTAASANPGATKAYAIPIDDAVKVADQIEGGQESSTIHIGLPPFLGVSIAATSGTRGAAVESLLSGGPAAAAGITPGSVITRVGGHTVGSGDSLKTVLRNYHPGDKVKVSWTDATGTSHSATVTLATGPAD
ncbi:MAG TPA: trypsin-like peptidase domain-containing protein [Jatrophihabitans sp.]|nr:trypsin-like peptidase domain-containing protein [Jatrophihabitans sp.]